MRVLITGGGGFIGIRLANVLAQGGHTIVLVDRAFSDTAIRLAPRGAERRLADITDRAAVWAAIEATRPDGIVHLAAVLSGISEIDPPLAFDINVIGTFNVLEGARKFGVKRVVATSSIAAVEMPADSPPADEDVPLAPLGFYGMTKATGEAWCGYYRRRFNLDTRVARPGAVVGPGREAGSATSNFTTAIIAEPLAGRRYVCNVREDDSSPLVYHTDLVDGLARLFLAESVSSPIYNLGACSATAAALARAVRARIPTADIAFEPDDVARFVVGQWRYIVQDNRRAERDFGYRPRFDTPEKLVAEFIRESQAALVGAR